MKTIVKDVDRQRGRRESLTAREIEGEKEREGEIEERVRVSYIAMS